MCLFNDAVSSISCVESDDAVINVRQLEYIKYVVAYFKVLSLKFS